MTESTTRTRVRENDRQTSWDAAAAQTRGKTAKVQRAIMESLQARARWSSQGLGAPGATDRELARLHDWAAPSGLRTRRHELEMAGWVTPMLDDEGRTVKRDGQTVWRAVGDDEEPPEPSSRGRRGESKHERGLKAARRWAAWERGSAEVADGVLAAYLDPEATMKRLDDEGAPA